MFALTAIIIAGLVVLGMTGVLPAPMATGAIVGVGVIFTVIRVMQIFNKRG